ncbi:MAG: hypothetical protein ISR48_04495 [Alphaproteobacteria bacterium]|nr:hypothetical protein [Alphaproteobacteria bacterium]
MTNFPSTSEVSNANASSPFESILAATRQLVGANVTSELTISSGSVTPGTGMHIVDTESDAATDDLANILTTNLPDGSLLILSAADTARTVVVKHNAGGGGQVSMVDAVDFPLDDSEKALVLRRSGAGWTEVGRFYGGDTAAFRTFLGVSAPFFDGTEAQVAAATGDLVAIKDVSDSDNPKFATVQSITDLVTVLFDGAEATVTAATGDLVAVKDVSDSNNPKFATAQSVAALDNVKGTDIASASPLIIGTDGNYFDVTGTTEFSIMTVAANRLFILHFDGALTVTHGASISIPGAANITTAAGDEWLCFSTAADTVRVLNITKADGMAVVSSGGITLGTEQATTSGTAFDFTGIPAGTKRITITFEGVSLSGTDDILVQLGDAGGIETSGYVSTSWETSSNPSSTSGFIWNASAATTINSGHMVLTLSNSANFTWISSHTGKLDTTTGVMGGGNKSLSAELTQVRITRTGSDTFDAGAVNILYE